MNIVIIRNAFWYDYGGGERFPVNLAAELQKRSYYPVVVSRSLKLLAYAKARGVPRIRGWWWQRQNWSGQNMILFPIYLFWQLLLSLWYLHLFVHLQPDVVHIQSKDDFIAATIVGRLLKKPIIWTDHADLKYIFANHCVWYKNPIGKLVYLCSKLALAVTLVSYSERELIEKQLGHPLPDNFCVIHNGINDERVIPYQRNSDEQDRFIFCATSRLVVAKGIRELIDAFEKLYYKHGDVLLWLVGDGMDSEHFKEQARNHASIQFVGHVDDPLPYVKACDVFVHPSYHEGFSLSLVEAAMLAKPVIACAVGGNPEIIIDHESGLLIPPKASSALLQAMETLYENRKLASRLGENARQLYEKNFRFDKIVTEQFIPLYEK